MPLFKILLASANFTILNMISYAISLYTSTFFTYLVHINRIERWKIVEAEETKTLKSKTDPNFQVTLPKHLPGDKSYMFSAMPVDNELASSSSTSEK